MSDLNKILVETPTTGYYDNEIIVGYRSPNFLGGGIGLLIPTAQHESPEPVLRRITAFEIYLHTIIGLDYYLNDIIIDEIKPKPTANSFSDSTASDTVDLDKKINIICKYDEEVLNREAQQLRYFISIYELISSLDNKANIGGKLINDTLKKIRADSVDKTNKIKYEIIGGECIAGEIRVRSLRAARGL
jgi:hypothetical protein